MAFDPRSKEDMDKFTTVSISPLDTFRLDPYYRGWWHGWIIGCGGTLTGLMVGKFVLHFFFHI